MVFLSIRKVMCRSTEPGILRTIVKAVTSASTLLVLVACLGIKPPVFVKKGATSPWAGFQWSSSTIQHGISAKAHGFLSTEDSLQYFDLDFPRLGILPVLVHIETPEAQTFSWKKDSFTLRRGGKSGNPLPFSRVEKAAFRHYGILMYSDKEISEFRQNFETLIVKEGSLPPKGEYWGLLFFPFPASSKAEGDSAVIAIAGKDSQGRPIVFQISLSSD